jgi:hypothetical protein
MLTYDMIAEWIGPVAEKADFDHGDATGHSLRLRGWTLWYTEGRGWDGNGMTAFMLAELCCAELVRRLNEAGWKVLFGAASVSFYRTLDAGVISTPYTHHPLEAVSKVAAEVLRRDQSSSASA